MLPESWNTWPCTFTEITTWVSHLSKNTPTKERWLRKGIKGNEMKEKKKNLISVSWEKSSRQRQRGGWLITHNMKMKWDLEKCGVVTVQEKRGKIEIWKPYFLWLCPNIGGIGQVVFLCLRIIVFSQFVGWLSLHVAFHYFLLIVSWM